MLLARRRRGVAEVIASLVMLAASAMLTSVMLYWGLAFQGASLSNFGGAIFRSNNQAAEQISIDNVLFTKTTSYALTIYARNFGDLPVKIAGVHIVNLQTGSTPAGADCEVNPHLTIVARAMGTISLSTMCTSGAVTLPLSWAAGTVSIRISTDGGTSLIKNYLLPP